VGAAQDHRLLRGETPLSKLLAGKLEERHRVPCAGGHGIVALARRFRLARDGMGLLVESDGLFHLSRPVLRLLGQFGGTDLGVFGGRMIVIADRKSRDARIYIRIKAPCWWSS